MPLSLFILALSAFAIGTTEFVIMGLLPEVAADLGVSIPGAGWLVTGYALGVAIGAPFMAMATARLPRKAALVTLMGVFIVGNLLCAIASDYNVLMFARVVTALCHGAFFGIGSVVAAGLVPANRRASAVALMFTGLTLANVLGVPFGTWLGHNVSWRLVFLVVAAIGLATALSLKQWVPYFEATPSAGLKKDLKIFRKPSLWLALAITSIGTGGFFAWFSYIAPLLTDMAQFAPGQIPLIMTVVGVGMTVGVTLGGRLADRFAPLRAVALLLASMTVLLLLNGLLASSQPAMLVLAFATGANALALGPPIQMLLIGHSREAEMLGSSLGQSGFNIGNATGAFLGGIPLTLGYSYASPQWVAAGMAVAGVGLALWMLAMERKPLPQAALRQR